MKLGFCTMGYLDYTTVEEAVRRIAKVGYEIVDFWAYSPHLGPDLYASPEQRKTIKKLVADSGLETAGLSVNGGGLALHINFSHSIEQIRKTSVAYYKACVDLAKDIACPRINMISGHMVYGTTREQAWEWNRECMTQVVQYAGEKGIVVALHTLTPCESRVMVTFDDALAMMREINHPNLKVMIDTADQNITDQNISDAIRKAGPDLVYFHANDNSGYGQGDAHLPPGRGSVDWKQVLLTLKQIGYKGDMTAQVHVGHPVDIDAWCRESYEYLSKVKQEVGGL